MHDRDLLITYIIDEKDLSLYSPFKSRFRVKLARLNRFKTILRERERERGREREKGREGMRPLNALRNHSSSFSLSVRALSRNLRSHGNPDKYLISPRRVDRTAGGLSRERVARVIDGT